MMVEPPHTGVATRVHAIPVWLGGKSSNNRAKLNRGSVACLMQSLIACVMRS